jgi:ribonuclease HI
MPWKRATFKDQRVWAQVDRSGAPALDGGRLPVRYSATAGAKVYLATAARVAFEDAAPIEDLPFGTDAPASGEPGDKPGARPGGKGAKGRGSGFGKAGTRTAAQAAAAKADATDRIAAVGPTTARCFTDGACKGNPGPAGSGVVVVLPDGRRAEASRALGVATNNVAELTAIGMALELLDGAAFSALDPAVVYTDSSYARGVLVQGWKAKANVELITDLKARLRRRPSLRIEWVAGHVGLADNERADALANRGVAGQTATLPFPPAPEAP